MEYAIACLPTGCREGEYSDLVGSRNQLEAGENNEDKNLFNLPLFQMVHGAGRDLTV